MNMPATFRRRAILLGLLCTTSLAGCASCKPWGWGRHCETIAPGTVPQPAGTYACQWQSAQSALAEQEDFVIYRYEWDGHEVELTRTGQDHLENIGKRLPFAPFSVVVQRSDDPALDESRKEAVVATLEDMGIEDAGERTTIGRAKAEPLYGAEAPVVSQGIIGGRRGGAGGRGGSRFGGGAGGSGLGGGLGGGVGSAIGGF